MNKIDPAIIEFSNDNFYLAFNSGDISQMAAVWAEQHPCVCVHPGWAPILGRDEVLQSWEQIFDGRPDDMNISCHGARVLVQGDVYSVICFEKLPAGWLVATNNFVIESGVARLVHHQASQCMEPPDLEAARQTIQ